MSHIIYESYNMTLYLQVIQTAGHFGQSLLNTNVDLQIYLPIISSLFPIPEGQTVRPLTFNQL